MRALLDSTVLIDYLRGRPAVDRVLELIGSGDQPATTAINVEEIVRGSRSGEYQSIRLLFSGLLIFPIDHAVAEQAGIWRRQYAQRGTTLAQADALIAATAAQHHAILCTGNPKDFPMPEVQVEYWPVGQ